MNPDPAPAITDTIALCWNRGNGIGDTIKHVRRLHGHLLAAEEVRGHFLILALQGHEDPEAQDYLADEPSFDCGITADGFCQYAGTDQCELECPR